MQTLLVSWQVYHLTKDPLALGLIGLSEALPFFVGAFWAGHIADVAERRLILILSQVGLAISACGLLIMTHHGHPRLLLIYGFVGFSGLCTSFEVAAAGSYIQTLIPKNIFPKAAAWNLTLFTAATIFGPIIGGWIVDHFTQTLAYGTTTAFYLLSAITFFGLRKIYPSFHKNEQEDSGLKRIMTGLKFIYSEKLLLGSMTLDLFAVLFGGAVALFPIFAEKLNVGPTGLGFLYAAPAFGSMIMALIQTRFTLVKINWNSLCWVVGIFGLSMIGFALSPFFLLALFFLTISGLVDSVSVIIRSSLLQALTPDHLRGRVVSVGSVFIRSSNEIGSFESGLAAKFMGSVQSVIFGGAMTLLTVLVMRRIFPTLGNLADPSEDQL